MSQCTCAFPCGGTECGPAAVDVQALLDKVARLEALVATQVKKLKPRDQDIFVLPASSTPATARLLKECIEATIPGLRTMIIVADDIKLLDRQDMARHGWHRR